MRGVAFPHVVPEGEGDQHDKDDYSYGDFSGSSLSSSSIQRFAAQVRSSLSPPSMIRALASSSWMPPHRHFRHPVVHERRQRRPVDGAHAGRRFTSCFVSNVSDGHCPGNPPAHPHLHVFFISKPRPAAAAEGLLPDRVLGHLVKSGCRRS